MSICNNEPTNNTNVLKAADYKFKPNEHKPRKYITTPRGYLVRAEVKVRRAEK